MSANPELIEALTEAAIRIREHLRDSGKWARAQEAQSSFHGEAAPGIASMHLCRETNLFARAVLEAAGFAGWSLVDGTVDLEGARRVPKEIVALIGPPETQAPRAVPHSWLVNEDAGLALDLSADQFGPDLHEGQGVLIAQVGASPRLHAGAPGEWFVEDSSIPETLQDWLNLPDLATPSDLPQTWRTDPVAQMLRQFTPPGETLIYDEMGEELRSLVEGIAALRTSLDASMAPDGP
ncbi:hypothetical protein [Palleronia sp.]|uniref:hypothetical protein n=1 Tax=Palleronia sp. TaxID=1940284 RepID=UPI0035C8039B